MLEVGLRVHLLLLHGVVRDRAGRLETDDGATDTATVGRVGGLAAGAVVLSRLLFSINLLHLLVTFILIDLI